MVLRLARCIGLITCLAGICWNTALALNPATQEEKRCIYSALPALTASCASTNVSTSRDMLVKLLQTCLSAQTFSAGARRPMRLLLYSSTMSTLVRQVSSAYSQVTSTPIQADTVPLTVASATVISEMFQAANRNKSHEAWMTISTYLLGEGVPSGAFLNLTKLVAVDSQINWPGLMPILRTGGGLMFASEVYALPITAFTSQIMYRKDVFAKYNIPLPRTWRELLTYARQWNGTDGMNAFCVMDSECYGGGFGMLWHLMAAMIQTKGYKQGFFIDPANLEMLLENEAMAEALRLLKGFLEMSPTDESIARGCPPFPNSFAQGQCMATIFAAGAFKSLSHRSRLPTFRRVQGRIGFMRFPGSEVVLDRPSKKLVLCDRDRCPYADSVTNPEGTTMLINRSPYFDASTYSINAKLPPDLTFFTYNVLSYLCSEAVSTRLALHPDGGVVATRASHLNVSMWAAAGYNVNDATEMVADLRDQLSHPNYHVALRVPGAFDGYEIWDEGIESLRTNISIDQVMTQLAEAFRTVLNSRVNGSLEAFRDVYWQSLNLDPSRPPPPIPIPAPPDMGDPEEPTSEHEGHGMQPHLTVLAVLFPTLAAAAVVLVAVRYLLRRFSPASADGSKHPPGTCAETTLVVSDIEDSTNLWEEMEAEVMDAAVKLHNMCIRKLVTEHEGYESVWEGDSFIIAFHHPTDAIAFCMELQQQLLTLAWPAPLLANPRTKEVWCHEVANPLNRLKAKGRRNSWLANLAPALSPIIKSPRISAAGNLHADGLDSARGTPGTRTPASRISESGTQRSPRHSSQTGARHDGDLLPLAIPTSGLSGLAEMLKRRASSKSLLRLRSGSSHFGSLSVMTRFDMLSDLASQWRAQWVVCDAGSESAVLAYRGLRVRLGLHA